MGKIKEIARDISLFYGVVFVSKFAKILAGITVVSLYLGIFTVVSRFQENESAATVAKTTFLWFLAFLFLAIFIIVIIGASKLLAENKILRTMKARMESPHYLQELDAKFFGLSRIIHKNDCELRNGGYLIHSCQTQLRATADNIDSIEHFASNPHIVSEEKIGIDAGKVRAEGVELIPEVIQQKSDSLFWKMRFIPSLKKGQKVEYYYTTTGSKESFAMDFEEMKKRGLNREFMSMRISYPTEHFIYKLTFPEKFRPDSYGYEVWLGEGKVLHKNEVARIGEEKFFQDFMEGNKLVLELKIKHPIHGLIYALVWIPPKKG